MKTLNGIFPVYKPKGITSSQFLEVIKLKICPEANKMKQIKMGHGGTLDKAAQGVLVVGIGSGCSFLPSFLNGGKEYKANFVLGIATDTYNKEGKVTLQKPWNHISLISIQEVVRAFIGNVLQKPPVYSALKFKGKRLSDLAQKGFVVNPEPRQVVCHKIEIIDFSPPKLQLKIVCGKGFYVRSLAHDLGIALGSCAYVQDLERTAQASLLESDCLLESELSIETIRQKVIETAIKLKI